MNFHDRKVIPPKYIYLFLSAVCFLLLFFSVILENHFVFLKKVTSSVVIPMQSGINSAGTVIYNRVTNHKQLDALLEENKVLNGKLDEAGARIKIYEQESVELKRLQALLALKEQYVDYTTVGARVIATDSSNWFYTFLIDKGSKDGVQVGCNILADGGLAGIVTEVGDSYAKVRAIINDNSQVSASVVGTNILCTVSGNLSSIKDGYINVGYINKLEEVEEGAELVTSHVSNKFLPGLLIGYVSEITMDANNLTKSAKCLPVVDFRNLQEVLVVLDLKANYRTDTENGNIYHNISDSAPSGSIQEDGTTATEDSTQPSSEMTVQDRNELEEPSFSDDETVSDDANDPNDTNNSDNDDDADRNDSPTDDNEDDPTDAPDEGDTDSGQSRDTGRDRIDSEGSGEQGE